MSVNNEHPPDHAAVFDLAMKLVTAQLGKNSTSNDGDSIRRLDDPSYDPLFQGAMRRAEQLLIGPVADISVIYAEQLFNDSPEPVSDEDIRSVFKEWGWPKLTGRKSIVKLMEEIECCLLDHLAQMERELETLAGWNGVAEREFILAIFQFCGRRTGKVMHGPWPEPIEQLAKFIPPLVHEWCAENRWHSEDMGSQIYEHAVHVELVRWCLGDRYPEDPYQKKKFSTNKLYRPWSLFRYLRLFGNYAPGIEEIRKRLQTSRNMIALEITPAPHVETYPRDFPEFNKMFDRKPWIV